MLKVNRVIHEDLLLYTGQLEKASLTRPTFEQRPPEVSEDTGG